MTEGAVSLYNPKFKLNMQFLQKAERERTKSGWREQHPNTIILTALIKFGNKYTEARVPVCIKVVAGPSVSLTEAQSKEIFKLLGDWLHPPGDIHLSSHNRRDMQRACIKRTLGQDRPYKVTCLEVLKQGYVIEVQLLDDQNERYPLSFTLKSYDGHSVDYDEGGEQNAPDSEPQLQTADADTSSYAVTRT